MALKDKINSETEKFFTNINENKADHGKHPNSLKNLKPWQKNESGNAIGRPFKFQLLKEMLSELGDEITMDYNGEPLESRKVQLLKAIWSKAIAGSVQHAKILIYLGVYDSE